MARDDDESNDPEALLETLGEQLDENQLRQFGCVCCRRVAELCPDPIFLKLLEFAEARAAGKKKGEPPAKLQSEMDKVYDSLYPGYGSPSPAALALTAVGEVVFTESALDAALNASSTAADAAAVSAAEGVDDDEYDAMSEETYAVERTWQAEQLRKFEERE